jgi:predicted DNA-binding WGR domain protein
MRVQMTRVCNNKERYYILFFYQTLFGFFCIERIYGASKNNKPTGKVREFFDEAEDAQNKYSSIMKAKISKGYLVV